MPIGSEYYFEPNYIFNKKNENFNFYKKYFKNYKLFFSGRDALRFLLRKLSESYFYLLPSYLCYEVIRPFEELNLNYDFYRIYFQPAPLIDFDNLKKKAKKHKNPLIVIIEYFGFTYDYSLEFPFILDISHSLLSERERKWEVKPLYIFGSLRKLLPLTDGGILFYNENLSNEVAKPDPKMFLTKFSANLIRFLHNIIPEETEFLYSYAYNKLDKKFEEALSKSKNPKKISLLSEYLLKRIPFKKFKQRRRENFEYLLSHMNNKKIKPMFNNLPDKIVPLNFPFWSEEKEKIKKLLVSHRIYPPTLWSYIPNTIQKGEFPEVYEVPKKLLSLPCDHRYNLNHMDKIIKILNNV